jgi:hypothetical protein
MVTINNIYMQCADIFMVSVRTKFHALAFSGSLLSPSESKRKISHAAMLLFYILRQRYLNKILIFFQGLLSYILSPKLKCRCARFHLTSALVHRVYYYYYYYYYLRGFKLCRGVLQCHNILVKDSLSSPGRSKLEMRGAKK